MSLYSLSGRQIEILKSLRDKAKTGDRELIEQTIRSSLPLADINSLCDIINAEYLMHGIDEDYEPNQYGHELEDLLDVINRPRISK